MALPAVGREVAVVSTVKAYRFLIASPSDVPNERLRVVEAIQEWNVSNSKKIPPRVFIPVRWELDSYPALGSDPQKLLMKQIVPDCDGLIGIFGTRLGSSTPRAESGTVEEIEEFIKTNRPAMVYFSKQPIDRTDFDIGQWQRLENFKETLRNRGLYAEFAGLDDLFRGVFRHLSVMIDHEFPETGNTFIEAGISIGGTPYDVTNFFQKTNREIYLIGQNLRSLLIGERTPLPHFATLLKRNKMLTLTIIITTRPIMAAIYPHLIFQYDETVQRLRDFFNSLGSNEQMRVRLRAHAGATGLSASIRDPDTKNGMMVFTTKWTTDTTPQNRVFCVVRKSVDSTIFNQLTSHVQVMCDGEDLMAEQKKA